MTDTEKIFVKIPGKKNYVSLVRRVSEEVALNLKMSDEETNRIKLCVDEAVSNVIRHCYSDDEHCCLPIEISFILNTEKLIIEITDYGKKVDKEKIKSRDLDDIRPHGLGVHFMQTIMDGWEFDDSFKEGNLLRMTKILKRD